MHFAVTNGNIAMAVREVPGWPVIVNLRSDPYEKAPHESGLYLRWYADNIWLFVPVQQKLKEFLVTLPQYPCQQGSSLNAAGINYNSSQAMQAMKRLKEMESLSPPRNSVGQFSRSSQHRSTSMHTILKSSAFAAFGALATGSVVVAAINDPVLGGGGPIANSTVTLWAASAGAPKQLAQTDILC